MPRSVTCARSPSIISDFQRECTPSYYNNESETKTGSDGREKYRHFLGETYGPGWTAFEKMLQDWRDKGDLDGMACPDGRADEEVVMNKNTGITIEDLAEPLTYGVEAFISPEYARAERDLLWPKVWQMAGRLEDIPEVGNFITYNILDESIVIVRTGPTRSRPFTMSVRTAAASSSTHRTT